MQAVRLASMGNPVAMEQRQKKKSQIAKNSTQKPLDFPLSMMHNEILRNNNMTLV